jgi:hypothetical protein
MSRVSETIISMMDKGQDIFDIAKYFGGIDELLDITKKYPYLQAMVQSKLGGYLYCSASDEDEIMIPFELPFIITELQVLDEEMPDHYDATVNVIIPELTESREKQILLSWLFDYLTDMGSEVGSFNDSKLNMKQIWIHVDQINGQIFQLLGGGVSDREVLEVIPDNYIND